MIRPSYILILLSFCFTYHINAICPSGYEQVDGSKADIPGCGIISCDSRYTFNDALSCSQECDKIGMCMSFSWAPLGDDPNHPSSSVCTLYNTEIATNEWGNGGQYLCKKLNRQTIVINGVTYINRGNPLYPNNKFDSKSALVSSNNLFALVLHSNGYIAIYYIPENIFMWSSNAPISSNFNGYLTYQSDANLVIYSTFEQAGWGGIWTRQFIVWQNGKTDTHNPGFCSMQDDGYFVCYDNNNIIQWQTNGYLRPSYPSYPIYPSNGIGYLYANHNGGEWCLSAGHINNDFNYHSLNWGEQNIYWCKNHDGQTCKCLGLTSDEGNGQLHHLSYHHNGIKYIFERDSEDPGKWNLKADTDGTGNPDDFDWKNGRGCHTSGSHWTQTCCIAFQIGDVIRTYVDVMDFQRKSGIEAECREVADGDIQTGAQLKWKY